MYSCVCTCVHVCMLVCLCVCIHVFEKTNLGSCLESHLAIFNKLSANKIPVHIFMGT